ncbi:MAG: cell division ATP-binding protein FtsE [Candidatus Levybacteria bacterium CG10_big_fil_rev_8_21_14_0_10_35_13]|nr:MAG: cell division ATP-binding protein FtsE [Candidatus Levybacteria bacterium CG10_big_fil_rev_8_21_14_0_10_35_13]
MIRFDVVSKKFATGTVALSEISLLIDKGEFVFLVGSTGSGKTTLLRIIIKDILPTEGKVFVNEYEITNLPKNKLPVLRKKIGMIFQDLKLLADRTVFENVVLPLEVSGIKIENATERVEEILRQVGLNEHKDKFPVQLSGGELQRVAIARALILSPEVLLADEPTGNLDQSTSWEIVQILSDINKQGTTVIMATHNRDILKNMNKRIVHIEKGKIIKDEKGKEQKAHKETHKGEEKADDADKPQEHKENENEKEESKEDKKK